MADVTHAVNTIVVMDNEEWCRTKLIRALGERYDAREASSVNEALLLAKEGARFFILDIVMKREKLDATGLAAVGQLRRLYPEAFIAVYTHFARPHRETALRLGADVVLSKSSRTSTDVSLIERAIFEKQIRTLTEHPCPERGMKRFWPLLLTVAKWPWSALSGGAFYDWLKNKFWPFWQR